MLGRKRKHHASGSEPLDQVAVRSATSSPDMNAVSVLAGYRPLKTRDPGALTLAMLILDAVKGGKQIPADLTRWANYVIGGDRQ